MGNEAVGILRPSDLVAECKSVLALGVDMKLKGNLMCRQSGGVEKGVLDGNCLVGEGVPDEGGRGGLVNVKLK